jgi:hypothetical protein
MSVTKTYTLGEPCPACEGTLEKARQPTAAERERAADKFEPQPLPPHYDTAPLHVVEELGELWRCPRCGYPHREKPAPKTKRDDAATVGESHAGEETPAPKTKRDDAATVSKPRAGER